MRLLFIIISTTTLLVFTLNGDMNMYIEINEEKTSYRVVIDSESPIDLRDLEPPSEGLSPRGAAIQFRDAEGDIVPICGETWRSSASLSSESPVIPPEYFDPGGFPCFYSAWFPVEYLFSGINHCVDRIETITELEFRIRVSVKTKAGLRLRAISDWIRTEQTKIKK